MRIKGVKTIEEYKQVQRELIQSWIDKTFIEGSVTWQMEGALSIRVTDKTGDSMVIALQDINQNLKGVWGLAPAPVQFDAFASNGTGLLSDAKAHR